MISEKSSLYIQNLANNSEGLTILTLIIIVTILLCVFFWIFYTLDKQYRNCTKMETYLKKYSDYKSHDYIKTDPNFKIESTDSSYKHHIRNYYIKTAYNACCGGGYKNNFVNLCSLKTFIQMGAKCLHLQIFNVNGEPVVAASTSKNNTIKETYNHLGLDSVFGNIVNENNKLGSIPDPLFLFLDVKSNLIDTYIKLYDKIMYNFDGKNKLCEKTNAFNKDLSEDFLKLEMYEFKENNDYKGKIFLIIKPADNNISYIQKTYLRTVVDFIPDYSPEDPTMEPPLKLYYYSDIVAKGSHNAILIDGTKQSLVIVLPDIDSRAHNYDPTICFDNGCQFIAMKFQFPNDTNLINYCKAFKNKQNKNLMLKPTSLINEIPNSPRYDSRNAGISSIEGGFK